MYRHSIQICTAELSFFYPRRAFGAWGKGTQRGPGMNGRIKLSLDIGGSALLGEPVKPFSILLM
jgi:hypothetical protein